MICCREGIRILGGPDIPLLTSLSPFLGNDVHLQVLGENMAPEAEGHRTGSAELYDGTAKVSEGFSQGFSERFGVSMARTVPRPDPGSG